MTSLRRLVTFGLLACSVVSAAGRWDSVFFYDHATEVLEFLDIAAPSQQRVVATGIIHDVVTQKKDRYVAMVTSDGGDTWQQVKLEDAPVSLFFLNDSTGWMVTEHAVWRTDESGRSWIRVSKHSPQEILRVWFLDATHGFAVGAKKTVIETKDGGKTWTPVESAKKAPGDPNFTIYTRVFFINPKVGLITGMQIRSARSIFPPYTYRTMALGQMLQMQTSDGGVTWESRPGIKGGIANTVKFNGEEGLILMEVADSMRSEHSAVFHLPLRRDLPAAMVYEGQGVHVTDIGLFNGHGFLAGVESHKNAELNELPSKVRILESTAPFKLWEEMEVAYNAEATHVVFAGADANRAWVATNAGMILRLKR